MSTAGEWRLGRHVPLHVYECAGTDNHLDDHPIAMFRNDKDARAAVEAHNYCMRKPEAHADVCLCFFCGGTGWRPILNARDQDLRCTHCPSHAAEE